jgi:succinate dehydrogenase flavin-adding protein (antitoxin of CptAB toxin-antitoxin module)
MPSPGDRRRKPLAFTADGRAYFRRFFLRACQLASDMESGLTEPETRTLKKLLKKLDQHLLQMISKTAKGTRNRRATAAATDPVVMQQRA